MLPSHTPSGIHKHTKAEGSGQLTDKGTSTGEVTAFQFFNFTELDQTTNSETKSRVRSHVMHEVHRRRRDRKATERRGGAIVLDTSLLHQSQIPIAPQIALHTTSLTTVTSPNTLGAGRGDPFINYPIQMNQRTHELFDHLRGDFCPMFKTMYKIGFFRAMTDVAGFRQILCTSASHMSTLRASQSDTSEATSFSLQAIQSVKTRLGDPIQCTSDGIIATILAFCCHAIMFHDTAGSLMHLNGLEEIIRRRGGLVTLEASPVLRMILFWADTNIAFISSSTPRFQAPYNLLPVLNAQAAEDTAKLLSDSCTEEDLASAISDMYDLNQLILDQINIPGFWIDGLFAGRYIVPILHKLLSISYNHSGEYNASLRQEATRTGAILYLGAIRCRFGVDLSSEAQTQHLKETLAPQDMEQVDYNPLLLLWLLVIGGTQSRKKEERDWFLFKTAEAIISMGCGSWQLAMGIVKDILWVDGLLQTECELLHQDLCTFMWNSYGVVFS